MSDQIQSSAFDGAPILQLVELMRHDDPRARADAACALGDRLRAREIDELEPSVVEAIAELLHDGALQTRFEAAMALAEAHDRRATPLLLEALNPRRFRLDAIRALGTLGDPAAIDPLRDFLKRWLMPWADKLQAAAALCALGDQQGRDYLTSQLTSRNRAQRAAAIHFIGESRHPDALRILETLLINQQEPMRDVAARALGFVEKTRALTVLAAARPRATGDLAEDIDEARKRLERLLATS